MTCSDSGVWALYDLGPAAGSSEYAVMATADNGSHWTPLLVNTELGPTDSFPNVSNFVVDEGAMGAGSAWFLGICGARVGSARRRSPPPPALRVSRTTQLPNATTVRAAEAAFADPAHGWIVSTEKGAPNPPAPDEGPPMSIQATSDGGLTWRTISTIPAGS